MVQKAMHFTPQVLLSAPRRSPGIPNPSGTQVIYTTSTYSFETHSKTLELRVLDVKTGESHELAKDDEISDILWLNDDEFVCLQAESDGKTSLYVASITQVLAGGAKGHYVVDSIDASAGSLRIKQLDSEGNAFAIVLSAQASPEGSLYTTAKAARKTQSTGRLYTGLYARHWDHWSAPESNTLWYAKLSRSSKDAKFTLSKLTNALKDTKLECPIPAFGGIDHFDVSTGSIILVAKDPELNKALNTKCNVYLVFIKDWSTSDTPTVQQVLIPDFLGACTSPIFNPTGTTAAFLSMKTAGSETDRNQIFVLSSGALAPQANAKAEATLLLGAQEKHAKGVWDRSPQAIAFSADGRTLFATAEEEAAGKLFAMSVNGDELPHTLTEKNYVGDFKPLASGKVFISGSSLVESSWYRIIDPLSQKPDSSIWSQSSSGDGDKYALKSSQVAFVRTPASNPKITKDIHTIVVKPSNFDSSKKYPVAYLIHGGPQGAWGDSWSTRWNLAVFAEQGYIVVAPNVTGSTGYGQALTDAIRRNWGGDPYQDIVNCFEWVGKNIEGADNERAVALGASYGGYMMNWIQGHDLGRKFKALVCHDGIFSFAGGLLATEELYFPFHDLGGAPWDTPKSKSEDHVTVQTHRTFGTSSVSSWRKWDPSEYLSEWATPELVIHSSKDYRLAVPEGLAAFNVLQARGVDSEFLNFPDENHFVLKPENSLVWHKAVLNFINKYVGLPPFADESPDDEAYYGGLKEDGKELAELPTMGTSS